MQVSWVHGGVWVGDCVNVWVGGCPGVPACVVDSGWWVGDSMCVGGQQYVCG